MTDRMVTATEAARVLGVDASTVRRHVAAGRLEAQRTPGGHWRVSVRALERLVGRAIATGGHLSWR